MKYLAYKEDTGKFNGWYDDTVHKTIPTPNIQVSEEEYQSHYNTMESGKDILVVNNEITFVDQAPPPVTWDDIRDQRNLLLDRSDYTQMPDNELTADQQQAWKIYRQALRRVPENFTTPNDVVWPARPE